MMPATNPVQTRRVVVVDDHTMIRSMLALVIDEMAGFALAGEAKDAAQALELCRREKPELLVLDLVLGGDCGLNLLQRVKSIAPQTRVLVFSGHLDADTVREALLSGAAGIIGKGTPLEDFKAALRAVASDRAYLCTQASEAVRASVSAGKMRRAEHPPLSAREETVLRLIAAGRSSREMARELGLSLNTISNYRSKLRKKTGLHRAVELSLYAARIGLANPGTASAREA
jgi:DNA-binding NarL/FixJ family response regulator